MKRYILLPLAVLFCLTLPAQQCRVSFSMNIPSAPDTIQPITVQKGCILPLAKKPQPEREGYRFAGWFTSPRCQPSEAWCFGEKLKNMWPREVADSMPVNSDMTLYARWVAPTLIKTAADLQRMQEDLGGWYVLAGDIDLSDIPNWKPIGDYRADYEWCDGEWWTAAFHGRFDGQGHTIRNLQFTDLLQHKTALFGAAANADIRNLTIDGYQVRVHSKINAPYIAPLIGIAKEDPISRMTIEDCHVKHADVEALLEATPEGMYASVTGLMAGIWNGSIVGCTLSGKIDVEVKGAAKGVFFCGGLTGETFSRTQHCQSRMDISVCLSPESALESNIGGLQASCSDISDSENHANVSVSGGSAESKTFVGGLAGSMRYGTISRTLQAGNITLTDAPRMQAGTLIGEFNALYGNFGLASGITETIVRDCTVTGRIRHEGIQEFTGGDFSGNGVPQSVKTFFGTDGMKYRMENCINSK